MRRSITVVVVGLFVGIWIGSCTGPSHVGAYQGSPNDWAILDLTSRVGWLETNLSSLELSISGLELEIMGLQGELIDANNAIEDMDSRLGDAQYEIDRLTRDVRTLQRSK